MTRNPYRPRRLSFWAQEVLAVVGIGLFTFACLWAFPLIMQAVAGIE